MTACRKEASGNSLRYLHHHIIACRTRDGRSLPCSPAPVSHRVESLPIGLSQAAAAEHTPIICSRCYQQDLTKTLVAEHFHHLHFKNINAYQTEDVYYPWYQWQSKKERKSLFQEGFLTPQLLRLYENTNRGLPKLTVIIFSALPCFHKNTSSRG